MKSRGWYFGIFWHLKRFGAIRFFLVVFRIFINIGPIKSFERIKNGENS